MNGLIIIIKKLPPPTRDQCLDRKVYRLAIKLPYPIYVVILITLCTSARLLDWWNLKLAEFCGHVGIPKIETDVTLPGLSRGDLGGVYGENERLMGN